MTSPRDPGAEPGPTEFSHGKGQMPPLSLHDPTSVEQHLAMRRVNRHSDDPDYVINYNDVIREE